MCFRHLSDAPASSLLENSVVTTKDAFSVRQRIRKHPQSATPLLMPDMPSVSLSSLIRSFTPAQFKSVMTVSASETARRLAEQTRQQAAKAVLVPDAVRETASVAALNASQQAVQSIPLYTPPRAPAQRAITESSAGVVDHTGQRPESDAGLSVRDSTKAPELETAERKCGTSESVAELALANRGAAARQAYEVMQAQGQNNAEASAGAQRAGALLSTIA